MARPREYTQHYDAVKRVSEQTGIPEEQVDKYVRKFFGDSGLLRYFRQGFNIMLTGFGIFKMKPRFYKSIGGKLSRSTEEVKAGIQRKRNQKSNKAAYEKRKANQKARNFSLYWERVKNKNNNN